MPSHIAMLFLLHELYQFTGDRRVCVVRLILKLTR